MENSMLDALKSALEASTELRDLGVSVGKSADTQKIIIPKGMSYGRAIKWLERQKEAEETNVCFSRDFPFHPADGAFQLASVLKEKFGWTQLCGTPGFFGNSPPELRTIQISKTESVTVPWGTFQVPGIQGDLRVGSVPRGALLHFRFSGVVWQRDVPQLEKICVALNARMPEHSIYRGRNIEVQDDRDFAFLSMPNLSEEDIILPEKVETALKTSLFTPLKYTSAVRDSGIPLKRGILLSGTFGTGKTLTAAVTATLATKNNWTFILTKDPVNLIRDLHVAKLHQPAVVFCEDIDQITSSGRTSNVNRLLEAVDGVLTKNTEVMLVMTTNKLNEIHGSFMRPGRLDAMIHFECPDAKAASRLLEKYCADFPTMAKSIDFTLVGEACEGMIPAAIREVCERSKLHAITRDPDSKAHIVTQDLLNAAEALKTHTALVDAQNTSDATELQAAKEKISAHLGGILAPTSEQIESLIDNRASV